MKTKSIIALQLLLCLLSLISFAQNKSVDSLEAGGEYPVGRNDASNPCITPQQYAVIENECAENIRLLKLQGIIGNKQDKILTAVTFNWPLRTAAGFNDCSYYSIYNYVDQDPTSGIKDWNCGSVSYDGHRGTDIVPLPFPFYKMDNNQVEVIAAAPGTIIDKADGNFDKNCAANSSPANYIIIQHADGSVALYWHMKKNSLTVKTIGQSVVTGEFLGDVGSSGSSTAPHLHFEVWSNSSSASLIDPYYGPCNLLNSNSWWTVQKPYTEPAIIKASVHTAVPVMPPCPETETPYEDSCFHSGGNAKFAIFMRNETTGLTANLRIVNPDGTTFSSWIHNSTNNYLSSWWYWNKVLPTNPGTYTFETIYNGITCSKQFDIISAIITASGPTNFCMGDSVTLTASAASTYLWSTGETTQSIIVKVSGDYSVKVTSSNGCSAISTITTVTVNNSTIATITASGATTFCEGDSVTLTASAASFYLWSTGATTQSIIVKTAGDYWVKITNSSGCSATSPVTSVIVNPSPIATITPNGSTAFCEGDSINLKAGSASFYLWSTGATTQSINVKTSGDYSVVVTNSNGCSATSPVKSVTVNPLPLATITPNGSTAFCEDDSITLTASSASTYQWSNGETTQSIIVKTSGDYSVIVTDSNGCSATSTITSITVNPLPSAPTITANGKILSSSYPIGNQWYLNGNIIPGAVSQTYSAQQNGKYTVVYTDSNGCSAISAPYNYISVGITELTKEDVLLIIPNPADDFIELPDALLYNNSQVLIYSSIGVIVYQGKTEKRIDISFLSSGIYFLKVKDKVYKFVKL
jgi:murein DD-endopeptidase MepM/ murein hydrolase activator NlpD